MKATLEGYSFRLSESVTRIEVYSRNRYGIGLAGDLYVPKGAKDRLVAVAVYSPFGAVEEQASGLYVDEMAPRGFAALAFDPSSTGESGEEARNVAPPGINTEDPPAAVGVLSDMDMVNPERIDAIGICDSGGTALDATIMDTRIKVTVMSTVYDMIHVNTRGHFDQDDGAQTRYEMKKTLNAQRTEDFKSNTFAKVRSVADPLPDDAPFFVKDYYDCYKTKRGHMERSLNFNRDWNKTSSLSFIDMPALQYSEEIHNAVLMTHGKKAHPCCLNWSVLSELTGGNKEFLILSNMVHTNLYDRKDKIPFHRIESLFTESLCQGRPQ